MDRNPQGHRRHNRYPTRIPPSSRAQLSPVDALLKKKSNPHLLESFQTRVEKTRSFLTLFRPDLDYELVGLHDVYGPTASDPDIQALVVSKETLSGATAGTSLSLSLSYIPRLSSPSFSRQGARPQGSASLANMRHRRHLIGLFQTRSRRRRDPEANKDEQHFYPRVDRYPPGEMTSCTPIVFLCIV